MRKAKERKQKEKWGREYRKGGVGNTGEVREGRQEK